MMGSMFRHGTKYSLELDLQSDCPRDKDREFGMKNVLYYNHVSSVQDNIHDTLDWITGVSCDWKSYLLVEYSKDWFSCKLMEGHIHDDIYRVVDDIIYYQGSIYLVPESSLREEIMRAIHGSPLTGHRGYFQTYRHIKERFSWKGLKGDVWRNMWECMNF
jgi:hypothetical protein